MGQRHIHIEADGYCRLLGSRLSTVTNTLTTGNPDVWRRIAMRQRRSAGWTATCGESQRFIAISRNLLIIRAVRLRRQTLYPPELRAPD